jgi:predicted aldo/keto reductase-like oxidoreductase
MKDQGFERRTVLKGGLLSVAAALGLLPGCSETGSSPGGANTGNTDGADSSGLPTGLLGKTGVTIPILGLGTSKLGLYKGADYDYDHMARTFSSAVDHGIRYLDTAAGYGRAEEAVGAAIRGRRDEMFVATKLSTDTREEAQPLFERSLERLGTGYVDVLHMHSAGQRNLDVALSKDGVWPYILEQKKAGRARFCGITGHNNPPNFVKVLQNEEIDVLMCLMNFVDHHTYSFDEVVLPLARKQNVGVMAMKVYGGLEAGPSGGFHFYNDPVRHPSQMEVQFDKNALRDAQRFAKSLDGVTGMVIGVFDAEEIQKNVQLAIETERFSEEELVAVLALGQKVSDGWADRYS